MLKRKIAGDGPPFVEVGLLEQQTRVEGRNGNETGNRAATMETLASA